MFMKWLANISMLWLVALSGFVSAEEQKILDETFGVHGIDVRCELWIDRDAPSARGRATAEIAGVRLTGEQRAAYENRGGVNYVTVDETGTIPNPITRRPVTVRRITAGFCFKPDTGEWGVRLRVGVPDGLRMRYLTYDRNWMEPSEPPAEMTVFLVTRRGRYWNAPDGQGRIKVIEKANQDANESDEMWVITATDGSPLRHGSLVTIMHRKSGFPVNVHGGRGEVAAVDIKPSLNEKESNEMFRIVRRDGEGAVKAHDLVCFQNTESGWHINSEDSQSPLKATERPNMEPSESDELMTIVPAI
jgi:hypothetical protein